VLYPAGFVMETEAVGSRYTPPPSGTRVLGWSLGRLTLEGGNLSEPIIRAVAIDTNNHVTSTGTNKFSLAISTADGTFRGSVMDPMLAKPLNFNGVLLQKRDAGEGYFLGTTQGGRVSLEPAR
jgi:hypothetical protein